MRTVIFGVGEEGYSYYMNNRNKDEIIAFVDNDKNYWGGCILNVPIYNPNKIKMLEAEKIVITSMYHEIEIREQLVKLGVDCQILSYKNSEYLCYEIMKYAIKRIYGISNIIKPEKREECYDRPYINDYLKRNEKYIVGDVLEFAGGELYSKKYGNAEKVYTMAGICHKDVYKDADYYTDLDNDETIPNVRFDCIIATQVIMYMNNPIKALLGLKRMLKEGGTLIVTVPGPIFHHSQNTHHMFSFTEESLKYICEKAFGNYSDFKYYGCVENVFEMIFWTKPNPVREISENQEYIYTMVMGIVCKA